MKCFLQTTKARYDICTIFENGDSYDVHYTKIEKNGPEHRCDRVPKSSVTCLRRYV